MAIAALSSQAEDLQLKDGTKISGTVVGVTGDSFQVKTAYGNIQVPRSQIVSITFPENQPVSPGAVTKKTPSVVDELLQGTTYTNRTAQFVLSVPLGWALAPELRQEQPDVVAALKSEDQTLFLFVTPEKFAGTLATYRVLLETQFRAKFKDYAPLNESTTMLDGKKSIKLIFQAKNPQFNDAPLKGLVYIIPYEGRMVRLTFLTLEPLFEDALPALEKIAASYRTLDGIKQATRGQETGGMQLAQISGSW